MLDAEKLKETLSKMRAWCDRADRCSTDVEHKILRAGASQEQAGELLVQLTTEGYLDDVRYADSFVSGHFRIKKWGRIKLKHALRMKGIPDGIISRAIQANIQQTAYLGALESVVRHKAPRAKVASADRRKWKAKLLNYTYGRGYEAELSAPIIDAVLNELGD
jgi:regulatory protein